VQYPSLYPLKRTVRLGNALTLVAWCPLVSALLRP
jgi:hypothetical protein